MMLEALSYHYKEGIKFRKTLAQKPTFSSVADVLNEMKRLIRLKHYSYSTEQTYLDWTKRFLLTSLKQKGQITLYAIAKI
jgi:hypothetical protein